MESNQSRDLIKSILIMAGIPLAFSVTCSLISRIGNRKNGDDCKVNTHDVSDNLKEQMFALRNKIEELQELEREIEFKFFRFIDLKDQEYALLEIQNSLVMEKERADFLEREVSSIEVENKKFDEMVIEYLKALEELESSRLENGLLKRRDQKLMKKTRESSRLIRKMNLKIEAREDEMLRTKAELKRKENVIGEFEREVEEMNTMISQLRNEKNELFEKLETSEKEVASKAEAERILIENYNRVVNELESLQKDRAAELKELIYLRWCHACLRHELARRNELEKERKSNEEKTNRELALELRVNETPEECIGHELDNHSVEHNDEPFFGADQQHRKRRWLARKFKKWVEGKDHKHHETRCFGSHSVVDESEDRHLGGRKSFSSV
ncbi:protein CHUP1, chloroplastic [Tanacetum coccineum]|uniref:Protein CHUP1, chloroplastic n=1 Tax=Tanacetum coccineum TaxID=301880 RepID=A0ABQ5APL9_9ASTR